MYISLQHILPTIGVSKESISKFLIGNRFNVKLRIPSPFSNRMAFNLVLLTVVYTLKRLSLCLYSLPFPKLKCQMREILPSKSHTLVHLASVKQLIWDSWSYVHLAGMKSLNDFSANPISANFIVMHFDSFLSQLHGSRRPKLYKLFKNPSSFFCRVGFVLTRSSICSAVGHFFSPTCIWSVHLYWTSTNSYITNWCSGLFRNFKVFS